MQKRMLPPQPWILRKNEAAEENDVKGLQICILATKSINLSYLQTEFAIARI